MVAEQQRTRAPLRALVVEDSEDDALLLLRELKRGGYEPVYERVDTPEAMRAALEGSSWDVIFSDYRMPRFGAPQALAMAREISPRTPFIVVSGKVGEDVAVETLKAGAYDYVMKDNLARLGMTLDRSLQEEQERRERRRAEKELRHRDAILDAVRFAADRFLSEATGWEESVRAVLTRFGEATGASRVYIFENFTGEDGELWGSQRYEWVASGVSAQMDNPLMEAIPYVAAGYGRWVEKLGRGEPIYGPVREFPQVEQLELREQDILSIVIVPIFVEGRWWGQIGFDDCLEEREWSPSEVAALGAAAGTLGAVIRRRQVEERLRGSEERYRAVIEQATDGIYLLDAGNKRLLETNPSFQRMLGYTVDEMRGMQVYDFVAHPRENVDATIERTLKERRRVVGGREYRRKDGSLVSVEVGVSVISYGGKEVICTIVRDVTERKRAEEALARSENHLRTIIETEPECVKVLGMNGSLLEMNPAGLAMIEADSIEQVRGKTVYDYIAPANRADFVELTERVLRGESGMLEFELIGLRGTHRWLETHAVPLREVGGGIRGVLAITRDVTDRKNNERTLRESEERFRTAFDSAAIGMGLVSPEGRWIRVNQPLCDIVGYPEHELLQLTFQDITHPDDLDSDLQQVGRVLRGEARSYQMEKRYLHKDGHVVWILISVALVRDGEGDPLYFISQIEDITQRKRFEGERKKNEEALRESQRTLATLMSNLPGMAYRCNNDPDWTMMFVSEGCLELTGYPPDDLTSNRLISYGDLVHPEDGEAVWNDVQAALEGRRPFQFTYRITTASGAEKWVWEQGRGVFSSEGELLAIEGFIADVNERKKYEEALQESERLYRAVIEQATENIFLVDVESKRIVESNPAFREALGYSERELEGMTLYDVVAADPESVDFNMRRTLEQGRAFVGERRYRRKDGTLLDVEVSGSIILRDGRETLCAVAHDVTERARAQRLLEERVAILSRVATDLTLDLPVQDTLDTVARSVIRASTAVSCSVALFDGESGFLRIEGAYGLPQGFREGIETVWQNEAVDSPTLHAIRERRPALVSSMRRRMLESPLYRPVHRSVREAAWDTVYIVPLVSRDRALGAILFNYLQGEEPGAAEEVFLSAVADQAAIAVENARLFSEARGKAVLEERQRLARELHDSVSQALYGIALGAKTARTLLDQEPTRAADPLDYVLSLSEAGLTEMRALIFELRPESLETEGLSAALEKQAAALRARHGIQVHATLCNEPEASPAAKEALYRIAQEALHNTVKHARATAVELEMACNPEAITLDVSDDGLGFDSGGDFPGHLGLRSMRERASRLGGTLEIESEPGRGTHIRAQVPVRTA